MQKNGNRITIGVIATVITIILGGFAIWSKAGVYVDSKMKHIAKTTIHNEMKKDLRDLRIMIQFNKMQAREDTVKWRMWNDAIDIVDHGGRID